MPLKEAPPHSATALDLPVWQRWIYGFWSSLQNSSVLRVDTGLTVTGTNTLSALAATPADPASVLIFVNRAAYAAGGDFTVSGTTVSWSAGGSGTTLNPGDRVFALYSVAL